MRERLRNGRGHSVYLEITGYSVRSFEIILERDFADMQADVCVMNIHHSFKGAGQWLDEQVRRSHAADLLKALSFQNNVEKLADPSFSVCRGVGAITRKLWPPVPTNSTHSTMTKLGMDTEPSSLDGSTS